MDAHAATWTYEGDRSITGDYLALGGLGKDCDTLTRMSDTLNPVGNFFNGTISTGGVDLGGRTPQFANQLGFDRDRLSVPEGTIGNGAKGASVCLGTNGDTYFFGGIAFDILIRAPNLHIDKRASDTQAAPGDTVTYTTEVTNPRRPAGETPTEPATNLVVDDPLPSGLDFAGFADDGGGKCSYNSSTRAVRCNVGTLAPGASFTFAYQATVSAAAQGLAPAALRNVACYVANSEDQPDSEFRGCDETSVEVPPNPYVDLGVVKTVPDDVVAPGATLTWTIVATNHGPGASTGFVLADQLPAGMQFVGHTADPALTCTTPAPGATGAVVCTAPSVPAVPAAGSSLTVTITATVPAGTANGAVLFNVVTVNGDQPEPTPDPHPNRDVVPTRVTAVDPPPDPARARAAAPGRPAGASGRGRGRRGAARQEPRHPPVAHQARRQQDRHTRRDDHLDVAPAERRRGRGGQRPCVRRAAGGPGHGARGRLRPPVRSAVPDPGEPAHRGCAHAADHHAHVTLGAAADHQPRERERGKRAPGPRARQRRALRAVRGRGTPPRAGRARRLLTRRRRHQEDPHVVAPAPARALAGAVERHASFRFHRRRRRQRRQRLPRHSGHLPPSGRR